MAEPSGLRKWIRRGLLALTVLVVVGLVVVAWIPNPVEVEVAEDGTRFVFDEAPLLENGYPAYGNAFVTQGYIYPAGTLDGTNGVNADGSPEFPELVKVLTQNFDKFPDVPTVAVAPSETLSASGGDRARGSRSRVGKKKNRFVGYTFKRTKDGRTVLASPGDSPSRPSGPEGSGGC